MTRAQTVPDRTLRARLTRGFLVSATVLPIAFGPLAAAVSPTLEVGDHVFHRRALGNGLLAIAVEERTDDTVSVFMVVGAGGRNETPETSGLAHLVEHALYTGTAAIPAGGHDARIAELGGESNAFTRDDYTLFYDHRIPAAALAEVLGMEADRLRGLTFDEAAVLHERSRLEDEEARTFTRSMARDAQLEAAIFTQHGYGVGLLDDDGHTRAPGLSVDAVRRFYNVHYRPRNTVVVVVGAVEPAVALDAVEGAFGALDAGPPRMPPEPEPDLGRRTVRLESGLAADRVEHVWLGPAMGDPDRPALHLLARWLSGRTLPGGVPVFAGMGGRADRDLIRIASSGPKASVGLDELVKRVRKRPLPSEDVESLRGLLGDNYEGLELRARPYFSLAAQVGILSVLGHGDHAAAWGPAVAAVTPEEVLRVARRYLAPGRRVEVIFEGSGAPAAPLPDDEPALREAALDAAESGDLNRSIQAYTRLLSFEPNRMNTVIYLASRGQAWMQLQEYGEAVQDFEDALAVVDYPAVRDLLKEAKQLQAGGGRQGPAIDSEPAEEASVASTSGESASTSGASATEVEKVEEVDIETQLRSQVEELQKDIESWRDLPFLRPVNLEILPPDSANPELAGWYEPTTERLVVVAKKSATFRRGTLLHELYHALQDQHFDLERLRREAGTDPDAQDALTALIEGEAMLAVSELMSYDFEAHTGIEPTGEVEEDRFQKIFHYGAGLRFVRARRTADGWDGVSALYRRPPNSTAEILHPELYPRPSTGPLDLPLEGEAQEDLRMGENRLRWVLVRSETTRAAADRMAALLVQDRWRRVGDEEVWDLRFEDEAAAKRFVRYAGFTLEDEEGYSLQSKGRDLRLRRAADLGQPAGD
ncbi:MAG: insulinase family protein [Acidobacteriota bacterium]